jgi:hypothetical protein
MKFKLEMVTAIMMGVILYAGTATAESHTCPTKDVVVERDVIDTAVNVGLITLEEAMQLRQDIAEGKKDIIDVDSPDGIITFGTITYDEELGENVLDEVDPEEGEYIDGEWYDAYH